MRFDEFSRAVEAHGLTARKCSQDHWQILGGERAVNVWANTKRGFRYQSIGAKARDGTLGKAIRAAGRVATPEAKPMPQAPWEEPPRTAERVGLIRWIWRMLW